MESHLVYTFPDPNDVDDEGLVCVGGNLSIDCLLSAYKKGIFPWFNSGDPYLWWSPNPRTVIFPSKIHISRSLKKLMKKNLFKVTFNQAFNDVIHECSLPRRDDIDSEESSTHTWITDEMKNAYIDMHNNGHAMSVEVWQNDSLVGGIYGVYIGRIFFGESMFSRVPSASKVAMVTLSQKLEKDNVYLIDCQMPSDHLFTMGAENLDRRKFTQIVEKYTQV